MKKIMFYVVSLVIAFCLGGIITYKNMTPEKVIITEEKIKYNTISKKVESMPMDELRFDLNCFYSGIPALSVKYVDGDEYLMSAELCQRKWNRKVSIKIPSKDYRNLIIGGLFFDSNLRLGANAQYYRMYGSFGIGGGVSITQSYGSVQTGIAFRF